jgi:hypothetical protein
MRAEDILALYNSIVQSHKRLPADAHERLASGETITIVSGSEEQWTSKLHLTMRGATMEINEQLPERMVTQLRAKQRAFVEKQKSPTT